MNKKIKISIMILYNNNNNIKFLIFITNKYYKYIKDKWCRMIYIIYYISVYFYT